MKRSLIKSDLKGLAEMMGLDYQLVEIKSQMIDKIKSECLARKISQRSLAKMVPGLSQDRVSMIFNGQIAHMTIDKLLEILSALNIKTDVKLKKTKAA